MRNREILEKPTHTLMLPAEALVDQEMSMESTWLKELEAEHEGKVDFITINWNYFKKSRNFLKSLHDVAG